MKNVEVGHHPRGIVADHDRLDPVRIEHRLGKPRVEISRERSDHEQTVAVAHSASGWSRENYFGVTFAVFCGEIIRCANGDPGNMIHGPPATGASEIPVVL